MSKIKLQKIVGNLLDKFTKIKHEWNGHLEICSRASSSNRKFSAMFASPKQIFYRKQSLGAPVSIKGTGNLSNELELRRGQKRHLQRESAPFHTSFTPSRSICQLLANFSGVDICKDLSKSRRRKRKSLSCFYVLQTREIRSFTS